MQPTPLWLIPAILVGFVVFFVGLWSAISLLLSTASGWRSMASRYPCPDDLTETPLDGGLSVRVGLASYRGGIVSFGAAPQGLKVEVSGLFPFHPPLLLPWDALATERGGGPFFAGKMRVREGAEFLLNSDALGAIEQALLAHRSGR